MEYLILRRLSCALLSVIICKELILTAVEPEDILAPAIGPVVILPKATLSSSYDDNVFRSPNNIKDADDFVTTFSPGIALRYGQNILDSNYIGLDYLPSFLWYDENNELNTDNHFLTFGINYQKDDKYKFSGKNQIQFDNDLIRGGESLLFGALGEGQKESRALLVERLSSINQYRFEYTLSPKTSIYLSTSYDVTDYDEEPHYYYKTVFGEEIPYALFDLSNWNNTVGFGWQAFPKIKFYGSYFYGLTYVESNLLRMGLRPNSHFTGGHILAVADLSEKISGRLMLGYQKRDFDRLKGEYDNRSHSLPIFEIKTDYNYTQKGSLSFGYKRGGNISIENPNFAIESDFLTLNINQRLGTTGKFSSQFNSILQLDSYENNYAKYGFFHFDVGLVYNFNEWMRSELTYALDSFYSKNKDNIDYKANRFTIGLSVGY